MNCPECAFKAKEENVFQDHAVKNHSLSHIFFGQSSEVVLTNFPSGEFSNATVVNQPDKKKDKSTTLQSIKSEFVTVKTEFHSEVSIEDKIIDPLEKIPTQEFIISDIKTEELEDITADIDEQSLNPNEDVSKKFNNQSTNIKNWNVFSPESQEMIPIEKFPKRDKTISIFKCQIPPKKSPPKPMIMKTYSYQEKNTYARLIAEALNNFPNGAALHPDSIYKAINVRYPQYKMDNPIWKADIRNNLSINRKFIQEGEYWKLAPDHSISISIVQKSGRHSSKKQDHGSIAESNGIGENSLASTSYQENFVQAKNQLKNNATFVQERIRTLARTLARQSNVDCPTCEKNFRNDQNLREHILNSHKSFNCSECNYKGKIRYDIENHMKSVHEKDWKFNCFFCNETFENANNLQVHNKNVHEVNFCHFENCEFISDLKSSLKQHITLKHGHQENVSNPDKTLEELINADETILDEKEEEKVEKSEKCGTKRTYTMSELSSEIPAKIIREEELPIISKVWKKCPNKFCNFGDEEEHIIEKHMRIVHINQCPHCDFTCTKGAGLKGFTAMADHIEKKHKNFDKIVRKSTILDVPILSGPSISSEVVLDMKSQVKSFQKEPNQILPDQGSTDDLT